MDLRLGKKAARHAVSYRFADYFDVAALQTPPPVFGHYGLVDQFHMLGNADYGCCVWSGAAHEHMVWSRAGGRPRARFLTRNVLSDYSAATGFDPRRPETDEGTDVKEAASYRRKTGVLGADGSRHRIDAYVALRVGNLQQLLVATHIFGATGVGLQLNERALTQFDKKLPWVLGGGKSRRVGGHYVSCVGRVASGNLVVVTWGRTHEMTPEFYEEYSDEALAYVSLELLNDRNLSPQGYDAAALREQLARLS